MQEMIHEDEIQETFYNTMIDFAFQETNEQSSQQKKLDPRAVEILMVRTLSYLCDNSQNIRLQSGIQSVGFKTIRGNIVTEDNVDDKYKLLFSGLLAAIRNKNDKELYLDSLRSLASATAKITSFRETIGKFMKFYSELTEPAKVGIVNVDTIRDTFYNIMVDQYYENIGEFRTDVLNMEAYIFICFSTNVIVQVLLSSKMMTGIKLCNNAIVTYENCPYEFKPMIQKLMELKQLFDRIVTSDEIIRLIKKTVSMNPRDVITSELEALKTPEINLITGNISGLAIKISQIPHFKEIIGKVLEFCIALAGDDSA